MLNSDIGRVIEKVNIDDFIEEALSKNVRRIDIGVFKAPTRKTPEYQSIILIPYNIEYTGFNHMDEEAIYTSGILTEIAYMKGNDSVEKKVLEEEKGLKIVPNQGDVDQRILDFLMDKAQLFMANGITSSIYKGEFQTPLLISGKTLQTRESKYSLASQLIL